jgi:sigma-E factor negative regulatory protein RseA
MTDQIREQMSALLDGELTPDEFGLLVRRMERDTELRRSFGVYVLAGEMLRSPGGVTASPGFANRVSAAIDAGHATTRVTPLEPARARLRWKRPVAAAAVAAGAALAAVLLIEPQAGPDGLRGTTAGGAAPVTSEAPPVGGSSPTPEQNQRFAAYLLAHGQYAGTMGRRNAWSNALATDPGITRVAYDSIEVH